MDMLWTQITKRKTNVDDTETETIEVSKLAPTEIADYVNSLKNMAKYWYDTSSLLRVKI